MEEIREDNLNELIVDVRTSSVNIALLNNKKLVEFNKERANIDFAVGDIYLGKVKKLMPGLNAAFVDIGHPKDAFLHYLDVGAGFQTLNKFLNIALNRKQENYNINAITMEPEIDKNGKISNILSVGQIILVQIAKEPIATKGPRLTSEISLAGRNIVLVPFTNKISISQKIKSNEEKKRLRKLLQSIVPENYGVIVRTIAENKMVAELDNELNFLIDKWQQIFQKLSGLKAPSLVISEINRTTAILRDLLNASFNQIVVNDYKTYEEVKTYINTIAPEKKKIIKYYNLPKPIFDYYGIEKQIKVAFGKTVPMPKGAYLIIEHTEAAHVIDVNSGNRHNSSNNQEDNALEINLIAAEEIARQLRLRDMGGIIVIDFIDMHIEKNKKKVLETMKQCMSTDRAKFHLTSLSKFCLMEITRQRVRPEIEITTSESCPVCRGIGKINASINIIEEIENNIRHSIEKDNYKYLTIKVHPFIHAYLTKGLFTNIIRKWRKKYKCKIKSESMMAYTFLEFHLFNKQDIEIY